jgi:hypothetical protein
MQVTQEGAMKGNISEICDRTQKGEERIKLRNVKTGEIGTSYACTLEGDTIQVELTDGSLDSWPEDDCEQVS